MSKLDEIIWFRKSYYFDESEGQIYFLPNIEFDHTSWNHRTLRFAWLVWSIEIDVNKFIRTYILRSE